jgi:phage terminase large subunit-like protein
MVFTARIPDRLTNLATWIPEKEQEYGSIDRIPDDQWYWYCSHEEVRRQIADRANLGLERLLAAPVVSETRRRAQRDLFFLNRYFLWDTNPEGAGKPLSFNKITEATHRPLCDLFIKKDPAKTIAEQDLICKRRLVLYPRGAMKSTCDVGDAVQWILCFPEIRILFLTATVPLAVGFVDDLKGHFVVRTHTPSMMNLYFPEYCVQEKDLGGAGEFTCPVWTAKQIKRKEPTVMALSIGSTMSGWHFEVLKCLAPSSWVYTKQGCSQVKELKIGTEVLTHLGRYRRVVGLAEQQAEKVKVLLRKSHGFPVECSVDHPFLTDTGWRLAKDLQPGDRVVSPVVKEIVYPPIPLDEDLWNAVGWWLAEGSVNHGGLIFSHHIDERSIAETIGKTFVRHGALKYRITPTPHKSVTLFVQRLPKDLLSVFKSMYVGPYRKQIPSWALTAPSNFLMALCRGLWDGDGDVRGSLTTVSKELAATALLAKQQLGLGFSCSVVKNGSENRIMRLWGLLTHKKYFSEYSIVDSVRPMGTGTVVAIKVEQDATICVPGAVTHNCDDIVSTDNSESVEQRRKVIKHFNINKKMLMPYGYLDLIGTRYSDDELYGDYLEKNIGESIVVNGLNNLDPRPWVLTTNVETGDKFLIGKGWQPKPEFEAKIVAGQLTENDLKKEDWYILFPENLPYEKLRYMQKEDELSFEGQINQNPRPRSTVVFDEALLKRHTVHFKELPVNGPVVITWDFAFSKKKGRDYSTAAVGMYNSKSQLFIIDLIRNRFTHTTLAKAVVDLIAKWHPTIAAIEDTSGSRFLEPTILLEAQKTGKDWVAAAAQRIEWFPPDSQKDAKKTRMASMHPWLVGDRLFFAAHLPHLDVLYSEFERCLTSHHHDDIPDVISQQLRFVPRLQVMMAKKEITTWSRDDAAWNLVFEENCDAFGRPGMGWTQPSIITPVEVDEGIKPESQSTDLTPMLGAGLCG